MYIPFGRDIKDEMLRCIGHDFTKVQRDKRGRYFKVIKNKLVVRDDNEIWQMLRRCGYAELISTQINLAAQIAYNTYALTEKGMKWLGRQVGCRIIPRTVIETEYKEGEVC